MKFKILILLLVTQLFSQPVDFMHDDFKEIVRFDKISFEDGHLDDANISRIISPIQSSLDKGYKIFVTVIGHSAENTDSNESLKYANSVKELLLENNIPENVIYVESVEAKGPLYVGNEDLSNRVMVSMYVTDGCEGKGYVLLVDNGEEQNAIRVSNDVSTRDISTPNEHVVMCSKDIALPQSEKMTQEKVEENFPYVSKQKRECIGKVIVVLIDNKQTQNEIEVSSYVGAEIIEKTNNYVKICAKNRIPTTPKEMSDAEIAEMFPYITGKNKRYDFYFENGKELTSESMKNLQELLANNKNKSALVMTIKGYTDTLATDEYNKKLSQERVEIVEKIVKEIREDVTINKEYYGEENLAVPTEDGVFEPRNRRVEIEIK